MEKKEQQQVVIPDYIIRKKEKESFERGFVSALDACESAYETLKAMPDLENIRTAPLRISRAWTRALKTETASTAGIPR